MRKKLWIVFFCAVLALPFPIFNLFSKQLSTDNHENRLLTTLPAVLQSPLREIPRKLDQFLVDNSPFRYQLVALDAALEYRCFGTSQSDQVLPGKDGWLFYKDGPDAARPVANYQGLDTLFDTEATLAQASAGLQRLADDLAESGCTLVLDLTPSKDRIYRAYMPDGYPIVNEENRTDRFAAYMASHTTVPVNWAYQPLCAAVKADPQRLLYFKTDTHWNHAGALLSLDGILGTLGMETRPFEEYTLVTGELHTGDMANVAALYTALPTEFDYVVQGYDTMFEPDGRSIGVVGDSFSEYYMPYLRARFSNAWRLHINDIYPELAQTPDCDILILEVTERNLDQLIRVLAMF